MPFKCVVPLCKANYKPPYVSCFRFPKDIEKQKIWLNCIHLKDYKITENSRVCIHHFEEAMIIREDKWIDKDGRIYFIPRKNPMLSDDAYPCCFSKEILQRNMPVPKEQKMQNEEEEELVCELHFKKTDFETEVSAYDPKTGVTITCPLARKRLKKGVVPSLLLPTSDSLSSNEKSSQQKILPKSGLSTDVQNRLKSLPVKSGLLKESSKTVSPTASVLGKKKEESKEMVKRKRKSAPSETSNKKTDSTSKLNGTHTSNGIQTSAKSTVPSSKQSEKPVCTNPEAFASLNVQVKREPLSDDEMQNNPFRNKPEENISENVQITNVRSLSSERSNAGSPFEEISSPKKTDENLDGNFYSKPLDMDQRDKAFGSFVACELSDLRENPALYMKTKQSILKLLTEAHFEQMSSGKKS